MTNSTEERPWIVYMIQTKSGKLYTGITNNLAKRLEAHKNQKGGARFFHFSEVEKLVYQEFHPDRSSATKKEILIKKLTRKEKLALIEPLS